MISQRCFVRAPAKPAASAKATTAQTLGKLATAKALKAVLGPSGTLLASSTGLSPANMSTMPATAMVTAPPIGLPLHSSPRLPAPSTMLR